MTWNDLASNWNAHMRALIQRFPDADADALTMAKHEPVEMTRVLARSHDLTEREAREEIEDWMHVQGLARDTADLRAHDAAFLAAE